MKKLISILLAAAMGVTSASAQIATNAGKQYLMNQAIDLSADFQDFGSTYFFADSLSTFDAAVGSGLLKWDRYSLEPRQAFNLNTIVMDKLAMKDFPATGYYNDPELPIRIDFIDARTVRIRIQTSPVAPAPVEELMLCPDFVRKFGAEEAVFDGALALTNCTSGTASSAGWTVSETAGEVTYSSAEAQLVIRKHPWQLILRDAAGKELTRTRIMDDNEVTQVKLMPFGFVKRGSDNSRSVNPVFSLKAGERIYGCGESPTGLNKAGQKVNIFVTDPQGPETDQMYKPVPFWFSNRGYGIFMHTSAPLTCDFGASYVGAQKIYMADEMLDMFLMVGNPKQILDEYTSLVGKTPMPPVWSFGTWMSRITYLSDTDAYEVARQLRSNRIPADVIHLDTGWFGVDWQCDYKFAADRFKDPAKMIKDLLDDGFHISLWQLPYFTPQNKFYGELVQKGLVVRNADGSLPYEDAVLDFTNPATVEWYQGHLRSLLEMGVGAIKVDFGEGAPYHGVYSNGRTGLYEHNLYPLRYNKAVWDVTHAVASGEPTASNTEQSVPEVQFVRANAPSGTDCSADSCTSVSADSCTSASADNAEGNAIIWARSAWAGSQRYPLHWGGDAANTNEAMLSTLHAGLSLGLSGFPFWSHDMGGFVQSTPEDLYRRWLPFGFLTSHTRSHGAPPTEPWFYNSDFVDYYRSCAEMKYQLMPYIVEQARQCTQTGLPMLRALFVEYPEDGAAWLVEDQYLFGSDIMVAPIFEGDDEYIYPTDYSKGVTEAQSRPTCGTTVYERDVYLPGGQWVDFQTGKTYKPGWNRIATAGMEAVILVRKGAVIPMAKVAQSTKDIDWDHITNKKF